MPKAWYEHFIDNSSLTLKELCCILKSSTHVECKFARKIRLLFWEPFKKLCKMFLQSHIGDLGKHVIHNFTTRGNCHYVGVCTSSTHVTCLWLLYFKVKLTSTSHYWNIVNWDILGLGLLRTLSLSWIMLMCFNILTCLKYLFVIQQIDIQLLLKDILWLKWDSKDFGNC